MSLKRPSDWDSSGAYSHFNLQQGERYTGANGQLYAHGGWPIDASAPRFDRYPMEENWDSRGWNASGTYPSIRMEPGRTYRVDGQTYAHDGWPIDDEPRGAAIAPTRSPERASRGEQDRDVGCWGPPSREDRCRTPRGPGDEGWVPPGVGLPPRARYYDDDPDDYLRPCSRYPYEDVEAPCLIIIAQGPPHTATTTTIGTTRARMVGQTETMTIIGMSFSTMVESVDHCAGMIATVRKEKKKTDRKTVARVGIGP